MNISKLCYELYKIDWKKRNITPEIEADTMKDYYELLISDEIEPAEYTYDDYLDEHGYSGSLYVCYDEFCDIEYHNTDYMEQLLSNNVLISLYFADINSDDEDM